MTEDLLGYNDMVERAMRSVVREALARAAQHGLPGNHHFYITFRTDHPDVVLPPRLREKYPDEMTIVLQHQFWGLQSDEEGFDVELSFNQRHEHLRIPFDCLITFADPSVNFGLQFHVDPESFPGDRSVGGPIASDETGPAPAEAQGSPQPGDGDGDGGEGANVVTLDAFRKK
jgi:hypothetical protein